MATGMQSSSSVSIQDEKERTGDEVAYSDNGGDMEALEDPREGVRRISSSLPQVLSWFGMGKDCQRL
jgi:hypothetical protein